MGDVYVRITEGGRRDRQRRIDAGDGSCRLKFSILHASTGMGAFAKSSPMRRDEEDATAKKVVSPSGFLGGQPKLKGAGRGKSWNTGFGRGGKGGREKFF